MVVPKSGSWPKTGTHRRIDGALRKPNLAEPDLAQRWLAVLPLRLFLLTAFLLILQLVPLTSSLTDPGIEPAANVDLARLGWLALAACLDLGWLVTARTLRDVRTAIVVQIGLDMIVDSVACLIFITGPVDTFIIILPFTTIIGATWTLSTRSGLIAALLTSVCLFSLDNVGLFASVLMIERPDSGHNLTQLFGLSIALPLVALLVGRLKREMHETTVLYDEILLHLSHGLLGVDRSGRIALINEQTRRLFGCSGPSRPIGHNVWKIFARERDARMLDILLDPDIEQGEIELEVNGRTRLIDIKKSFFHDARGSLRAVVGVFIDATLERKTQQAETRAANLEGIAEIALGFAHEVRNPLTTIRGCIQELARLKPSDASYARLVKLTQREADRVERLLNEFVDLSRLQPRFHRDFNLRDIANEAVMRLERSEARRDIEIVLEGETHALVHGDSELMLRALVNIGKNGLEAMDGEGRLSFHIQKLAVPKKKSSTRSTTLRILRGWQICVRDTGPGIPPEKLATIFAPFNTSKSEGLGLGLALALKIFHSFGGTLEVENDPEGGARFLGWVPRSMPSNPSLP